jgi:hypothetical protein
MSEERYTTTSMSLVLTAKDLDICRRLQVNRRSVWRRALGGATNNSRKR